MYKTKQNNNNKNKERERYPVRIWIFKPKKQNNLQSSHVIYTIQPTKLNY